MLLIDRKRINNLLRFNTGLDNLLSATSSINSNYSGLFSNNPMVNGYFLKQYGATLMPSSNGNIRLQVANGVNQIGDAFSLNSKFTDSTSSNLRTYGGAIAKAIPGKWGTIAQGAVSMLSDGIGMSKYRHTDDLMMNEAGTTESSVNGIGYTRQNFSDTSGAYKDVRSTGIKNAVSMGLKGSAAGFSVGGPVGAVIGGLLGNGFGIWGGRRAMIRQRRINRNNTMQTLMINQQQQAYADSIGLQNKYYADNGDTTDDILYANRGKDLMTRKRINNIIR